MAKARPTLDAECVTCHAHLPERDHVCLATKECLEAYVAYCVKNSNGMRKAEASNPDGFRETILRNHQQKGSTAMATKTPSKPRAPKADKAPSYCRHCGGQTGGGKFLPGHDAALHGILIRGSQAGVVDMLTELICYGWSIPEDVPADTEAAARAAMKGLDAEAFQVKQADARIKKFDAGGTLESVYGDTLKRQPKPRKPKAEKAPAKPTKAAAKKSTARKTKAA